MRWTTRKHGLLLLRLTEYAKPRRKHETLDIYIKPTKGQLRLLGGRGKAKRVGAFFSISHRPPLFQQSDPKGVKVAKGVFAATDLSEAPPSPPLPPSAGPLQKLFRTHTARAIVFAAFTAFFSSGKNDGIFLAFGIAGSFRYHICWL